MTTLYEDLVNFESKHLQNDKEAIKEFKQVIRRTIKETRERHSTEKRNGKK